MSDYDPHCLPPLISTSQVTQAKSLRKSSCNVVEKKTSKPHVEIKSINPSSHSAHQQSWNNIVGIQDPQYQILAHNVLDLRRIQAHAEVGPACIPLTRSVWLVLTIDKPTLCRKYLIIDEEEYAKLGTMNSKDGPQIVRLAA